MSFVYLLLRGVDTMRSQFTVKRMTSQVLTLCFIATASNGCANLAAGSARSALEDLRGADRVSITRYAEVDLNFDSSASKIAGGMIAAGIYTVVVNDRTLQESIFTQFALPDPAALMDVALRTGLREKGGLNNLSPQSRILSVKDTAATAGEAGTGDYELEIRPVEISISEHVFRKPRFEMLLVGRAKLVRVKDQKKIWSGICTYFERDDKRLLFDSDPIANNAAILREVIPIAAEGCARKLETSLLGMT